MIDIKFIRQNPDKVKEGLKKRGVNGKDIDEFLDLDGKWRKIKKDIDDLKSEQKKLGKERIEEAKKYKEKIKLLESQLPEIEKKRDELLEKFPNLPQDDVPVGKDEKNNVVLKEVGEKPKFDFKPKEHIDIGSKFNLIDTERAAKVAGSRFGYLLRDAAILEFALVKLAYDNLLPLGFSAIVPPVFMKPEVMLKLGYDPENMYFLEKDNLYLVATSEHSVVPMHQNETFNEADLPKRYLSFSTCFRRESGSYGKDVRGILRVHQFDKIEMVSFTKPEDSKKEHEFFLSCEEKLMQLLMLPYRVMRICTGDMARPTASQFDIETWLPGQNQYRETQSTSNTTDFQARCLNIKYKDSKTKKSELVHILNGTAFAIGRMIIAILENYQQKDGSVIVPEALREYVGKEIIR